MQTDAFDARQYVFEFDNGCPHVLEIETDDLRASRVICLTLLNITTGAALNFGGPTEPSVGIGVKLAREFDLIMHGPYAADTIERLHGVSLAAANYLDTLMMSRRFSGETRHGKSDWALRLGLGRLPFRGAPEWTEEAAQHCEADARLVAGIYETLLPAVLA